MNRRQIVLFIVILFLIIEGAILVAQLLLHTRGGRLQKLADAVYGSCRKEAYTPSCYDREIPKLMDTISMEDAFRVARIIQEKDPKYLYCHVLGHNVSYRETSKDLSKWKDVVARCPANFCNNGCQHGALMRRFNAESLTDAQIVEVKPDLLDVCEPRGNWNPTEVERSMCYHALGHLSMFVTDADIRKSLGLCREIGMKPDGRSYVETCTQGVLMTVYQPLEPEDYALVKGLTPTKDRVNAFCSQFTGGAWIACHNESWPLFLDEIKRPEGLMKFCAYTSDYRAKEQCISTAMNILTVLLVVDRGNDLSELTVYCNALGAPYTGSCFKDAAFRLVQIDPRYVDTAIDACEAAEMAGFAEMCFPYLLQHVTHSFHAGSKEAEAFCRKFQDPWQSKCREYDNQNMAPIK